jgi:hypothetical protein
VTLEIRLAQTRLLNGLLDQGERFAIVGATALLHHVALPSATNDVDLAIVADDTRVDTPNRGSTRLRMPKPVPSNALRHSAVGSADEARLFL